MAVKISKDLGVWVLFAIILAVFIGGVAWEIGKVIAVWKWIFS